MICQNYFSHSRFYALLAISYIIFFSSCSKEIEIDTKNFIKKPVINSIFNSKKPFFFQFSYTQTPQDIHDIINDSIHVILFEDNIKILDTKTLSDTLATKIYPSWGNYKVKVKVEGYDTLIAYDTIPMRIEIEDATIRLGVALDNYGDKIAEVGVTFTDPAHKKNYYEVLLVSSFMDKVTSGYVSIDSERELIDSVLINEGDKNYSPTTFFFSDEMFDGQNYTLRFRHRLINSIQHRVVLRSISRNYYMYRKYWTRHYFNQPTHESALYGLIYKGEAQNMFTNIVNGYGIFAGYNESVSNELREL